MINEGDKAPGFALPGIDQGGTERVFSLADYRGSRVVLYFYPRDNTPGCTTEACDFRDNIARLSRDGVQVIGISPDSIESHKKFIGKHSLTFTLLSDPEKKVAAEYGAYGEKKLYGKTSMGIIRSTFIIDTDGVVTKAWRGVKVKGHVDAVLSALGE